ncbi:hypothetical protein ACQY0O_007502 [Thecaphora frezii]
MTLCLLSLTTFLMAGVAYSEFANPAHHYVYANQGKISYNSHIPNRNGPLKDEFCFYPNNKLWVKSPWRLEFVPKNAGKKLVYSGTGLSCHDNGNTEFTAEGAISGNEVDSIDFYFHNEDVQHMLRPHGWKPSN